MPTDGTGSGDKGGKETFKSRESHVLFAALDFAYVVGVAVKTLGQARLGKPKSGPLLANRSGNPATEKRQRTRFHSISAP